MPTSKDMTLEELQKAVEDEKSKKTIAEEPLLGQTTYVIPPDAFPIRQTDILRFYGKLHDTFRLSFDDDSLREQLNVETSGPIPPEQGLPFLQRSEKIISFRNGMLLFPVGNRVTPILSLKLSSEAVEASVLGTTVEAKYIAEKTLEFMWDAAGIQRNWNDISKRVDLVGFKTTSQVDLGCNLLDLFSESFNDFITKSIVKKGALGEWMGRVPPSQGAQDKRKENLAIIPVVVTIETNLSIFDPITGRQEDCDLRLDIHKKSDRGKGLVTVTSELDSERHSQLLTQLKSKLTKTT